MGSVLARSSFVLAVVVLVLVQGCAQSHPSARPPAVTRAPAIPLSEAEVTQLLYSDQFASLDQRYTDIQRNYKDGLVSDEDLRNAFRVFYPTDAAREAKYNAWVAQFPRSYAARAARGTYYRSVGLQRRGGEFISDTSDAQLRGMESYFARATQDLRASLALDDKPMLSYMQLMDIAAHAGTQDENREILDQSLALDPGPGNFVVRLKYMGYLAPRWGGSVQQMRAFLEECRKAQLSAVHLQALEALIVADEAATYRDAGNWPEAERSYRQAIALGSDDCLACLAYVVMRQEKFEEAIPLYSQMLAENPDDVETLKARAFAYQKIKRYHEASLDWQSAIKRGDMDSMNKLLEMDKEMAGGPPPMLEYPVR